MKIEFYPSEVVSQLSIPAPKPAKEYLPQWYTDQKMFYGQKPIIEHNVVKNNTIRACVPFSDALSAGYIQETWSDIYIERSPDKTSIRYQLPRTPHIIGTRKNLTVKLDGFYNLEFIWQVNWLPKVPRGYSVLITHPLNRFDLPFVTATGVIDSDDFYHTLPGSNPFYIKEGFEGIIPAGTPMYQMIPFKRDDWESKAMPFDPHQYEARNLTMRNVFIGSYKRFFHKKKVWK